MKAIIFGAAVLAAAATWAQLGETPDQCAHRYGPYLVQKTGSERWFQENEYRTNGLIITVRFITLATGTRVAGWIQVADDGTRPLARTTVRTWLDSVAGNWKPLREDELAPDATDHVRMITREHNRHVREITALVGRISGRPVVHAWMCPTAYAGDDGNGLTLFSDVYQAQWRERAAN